MSEHAPIAVDSDRLFPIEPRARDLARSLHAQVADSPIISPHGHTDPAWFAENAHFSDPLSLLVLPDHYLLRMLYSRGVDLQSVGLVAKDAAPAVTPREGWRCFAKHYYLFQGTPSKLWLDSTFQQVFGLDYALNESTADQYFDHISSLLAQSSFKPRALLDRFNIQFIATTEHALDSLHHHEQLTKEGLSGRITTTFRPDDVLDPYAAGFNDNVEQLGVLTGESVATYDDYLQALRRRRSDFKALGATASDHGPASPLTTQLTAQVASQLFDKCRKGTASEAEKAQFRGHMLIEMAFMSLDDGLVMQIHPGALRNHNRGFYEAYGADKGGDIPQRVDYCHALQPLLNAVGNEPDLELIVFTLDESTYARELAPLAGHYPALRLGPPWWFHDSPEGMLRFRRSTTETAGFYNTAGFNDDTRAFFSIPARHDMARRIDARFLAEWVLEGRITEREARSLIHLLTTELATEAYRLNKPAHSHLARAVG